MFMAKLELESDIIIIEGAHAAKKKEIWQKGSASYNRV